MPLSATAVKQAKPSSKPYKLSDARGMYLQVMPNGGKYWRYKYRYLGREKTLAMGTYPDVSLAEARSRLTEARRLLANAIDPSEHKKQSRLTAIRLNEDSFEAIAREWFTKKMSTCSESHRSRTIRALEKDLFPHIGRKATSTLTAPEILSTLRRIESRGAIETAQRAKQTVGQIMRYAVATGRAERDPTADLKGALTNPKRRHFAAITNPSDVGKLLLAIDGYSGTQVVKTALQLSPLLLCRPGELRHMEWQELNFDQKLWEIPGHKMKAGTPHIVPLSQQAIQLVASHLYQRDRGKYVLPSARGTSRPLSENGVRTALRSLGYDNETMTPHGFRAMGRTLLDEVLNFRVDYIEQQLAHAVRDSTGRAYNRTAHLSQRKIMMQSWADYLDQLKAAAREGDTLTHSIPKESL